MKKNFADKIVGLCGIEVVGERNAWNVVLTVAFHDGKREAFSEGAVRSCRGYFISDDKDSQLRGRAPHLFNRDAARRERDNVLIHMNTGLPVYIETVSGIEEIHAVRDFGWEEKLPSRLKVRARRISSPGRMSGGKFKGGNDGNDR